MTEVPSVDSNQLKPSSCSVRIIEICPSSVEHAVSDSEKISEFEIIPALFCPKKEKKLSESTFVCGHSNAITGIRTASAHIKITAIFLKTL